MLKLISIIVIEDVTDSAFVEKKYQWPLQKERSCSDITTELIR